MMDKLWYKTPARRWREALPLGNGFMGLMVFGGKRRETLCLNEGTLWSGYPKDYNSEKSAKALGRARELIFQGKNSEADALCEQEMCGDYSEAFMPLGNVYLRLHGVPSRGYKRELALEKGLCTVQTAGVRREAFCSNPDRVAVYHITADKPFSLTVTADSKLHFSCGSEDGALVLTGTAPDYAAPNYLRTKRHPIRYDANKGMAFCLRTEVETDGAVSCKRGKLNVRRAKTVTLLFAAATGFLGFDKMPDTSRENAAAACKAHLADIPRDYKTLLARHTADFGALYTGARVSLGTENTYPTDELLAAVRKGENAADFTALCELFYNFGKYLTISASRKGGQAMNLQGIWNESVRPPWSSNYTVNINTEMNYWGASRAGLLECVEPLLQLVYETVQNGKKTAQVNYGCRGFACNHNVDLWRKTPPVQRDPSYMFAPLCGVWLANEVYAHYRNGALQEQTEKVKTIVSEAAQFAADFLVLQDGYYVTCPSPSPENVFQKDGVRCKLDYASAFDMGLVRQSFQNYRELFAGEDTELSREIAEKEPKLYPFCEGKNGICEWHTDYDTPEPGHRHFSPLYAFYPGNILGYDANPRERAWVEKLFRYRLANSGQHIGWSAAWAICLSGKLRDGKTAQKVIHDLLCHAVFRNLFCVHPPFLFQIDGNLGFVAGMQALLLQEEAGVLTLLPALPENFAASGRVTDLLVRGAKVSFSWRDGKVTAVSSDRPVTVLRRNLSDHMQIGANVTVEEPAK